MNKLYVVTFITKKGGYKIWMINVSAPSAKKAKEIAKNMWEKDFHMFSLYARQLKYYEEFKTHTFLQITYKELNEIYYPKR